MLIEWNDNTISTDHITSITKAKEEYIHDEFEGTTYKIYGYNVKMTNDILPSKPFLSLKEAEEDRDRLILRIDILKEI